MRPTPFDSKDSGSIAPLGLGLATLSLFLVLVLVSASGLLLEERRLTSIAESTALAIYRDSGLENPNQLESLAVSHLGSIAYWRNEPIEVVEATSPDGLTVRVRLCSNTKIILPIQLLSEYGKVCAEGLARAGR
jgi:hypothetical protein